MYQKIHEEIQVVGLFKKGKLIPKKLLWGSKELRIDQITLESDFKDGGILQRMYAVTVGPNTYRLLFNADNQTWYIEEVWCE